MTHATTSPAQVDKDAAARRLANIHFSLEIYMTRIFRLRASAEAEADPKEPIKLLEVNEGTVSSGVLPLSFGAAPNIGIPYPCVIVEVTPDEFARVERGELALPHGWTIGEEYPKPDDIDAEP